MNVDPCYGDKEILEDGLNSQKLIASGYNTFATECNTPAIRDDVMKILNEEHQIQNEIFKEMQTRGWYQTPEAQMQKIEQTKQKYQSQ